MYKKISVSVIMSIVFYSLVYSQDTHEFKFASDYTKSLQRLKNNVERAKEFSAGDFKSQKDFEVAILKNTNLAIAEWRAVRLLISKYETSPNPAVKKAAQAIIKTYDTHLMLAEKQLALQKILWRSQEGADQEQIRKTMKEIAVQSTNAWSMLGNCSILVTNSLVSRTPDEKGELSYLAITSEERRRLIEQLDVTFGDIIKGGTNEKQTQLEICAAVLRQALAGEHKSSDER